ncbi:hypothetical protein ACHAW6_000002, partial [Cyclotella cf. meneghiniana]
MMHLIKFILLFLFQSISASVDTSENNAVEVNAKIDIPRVDGNCLRSNRLDTREVSSIGNLMSRYLKVETEKDKKKDTNLFNEKQSQDKLTEETKDNNGSQKKDDKKEVTLEKKDKDIF